MKLGSATCDYHTFSGAHKKSNDAFNVETLVTGEAAAAMASASLVLRKWGDESRKPWN